MVVIYEEDSEEVRKDKREANMQEMKEEHQIGAIYLLSGVPLGCKVEQPRDQLREDYDGIQGVACWMSNGNTWIRYKNGANKYEYHMGFAGPAREQEHMNTGETIYPRSFQVRVRVREGYLH